MVSNIESIQARDYLKGLKPKDFQEVIVRKTPKADLKYQVHVVKVWIWIAPSHREAGQQDAKEGTLVIRKSINEKKQARIKYSLSNIITETTTIERFAYVQGQWFWIEKSFKDGSKDIGFSDYQVRKYHA